MGGLGSLKGILSALAAIAGFLMIAVSLGLIYSLFTAEGDPLGAVLFTLISLPIAITLFVGGNVIFLIAAAAGGFIFKVLAIPVILVDFAAAGIIAYIALNALTEGKIALATFSGVTAVGMAAIPIYIARKMLGR